MLSTEVKFSYLIDRIDANFYITQIKTLEELETSGIPEKGSMEQLCTFPRSRTPGRYDYTERGIPVIKLKNITDYFIDLNDTSFIPERLYLNYIQPKEGDILITATGEGTVGRVGIFKDSIKCIVTGEVMIVRVKKDKINPYFLFSYLRSKYGKPLIIRFVRGSTGQTHLYSKDVKFISVPIPLRSFQEKIENLVIVAHEKRNLADQKYKKVKQLLYKELRISRLKLKEEKTFESSFSEIKETMRFDSEYYKPKFTENLNLIKNAPHQKIKLEEVIKNIKYGTSEKVDYIEEGTPFLRVTEINNFDMIDVGNVKRIPNYELQKVKNAIAKQDNILISRTGTLGVAVYIDDELDNSIFGSYFIKIVVDKNRINPLYLSIFLNSELGRSQSERGRTGAIQTNLTIPVIKSLKVVIPSRESQEKICQEYLEAIELRKESRKLLEKAKKEVEEMIENSPPNPQKNS